MILDPTLLTSGGDLLQHRDKSAGRRSMTEVQGRVAAPGAEPAAEDDLTRRALDVLDANWLGHATQPSPRLYPHQWSWDSACIAIGRSRHDQPRAESELRSLFAGQWGDGLLPHIVFSDGDGRAYFPGPEFWQTERSPEAPAAPRTSGIVQPPIHATAALAVYRHGPDRERAGAFLAELFPGLEAWHGYLYRERVRGEEGLAEIWHPWESGMDNSPLWDEALARIAPGPGEVPAYSRVDVDVADAAERPTDRDYDRYAYLVGLFRELAYRPGEIRASSPFAVQPVLFNALLVQGGRDLAEIARVVEADPEPFEAAADRTAAGIEARLWDDDRAVYADYDVRAGALVPTRSAAGLAPLFAGVPSDERAARMVERLAASRADLGEARWAVTSLAPDDPRFEPALYWRGPVWPILNWVLYQGLVRYGHAELAAQVRLGLIELSRRNGFWEHYSPTTGRGHGGEQFAWTAALVLDLLGDGPVNAQPDGNGESASTEGRS
jgi:Trehalase